MRLGEGAVRAASFYRRSAHQLRTPLHGHQASGAGSQSKKPLSGAYEPSWPRCGIRPTVPFAFQTSYCPWRAPSPTAARPGRSRTWILSGWPGGDGRGVGTASTGLAEIDMQFAEESQQEPVSIGILGDPELAARSHRQSHRTMPSSISNGRRCIQLQCRERSVAHGHHRR